MSITCKGADRIIEIQVQGEVDHHRARDMMMELDREIDRYLPRKVDLNLSGVSFMDSSGIALILRCHRRVQELGGEMKIIETPAQADKVLRAAGINHLITFE